MMAVTKIPPATNPSYSSPKFAIVVPAPLAMLLCTTDLAGDIDDIAAEAGCRRPSTSA